MALLNAGLSACKQEAPLTEPEGGYLAFRDALLAGNSAALWPCLAQETQQVFRDAWTDLNILAVSINNLSPSDQVEARDRTALFLLEIASDPQGLFQAMVRLENLVGDEALRLGSAIDDITVDEDGRQATVTTKAQQQFELVEEEDGVWRVRSLTGLAFDRLRPLSDNLMAVEVMVAESGYMRRSHEEIVRLLGGTVEAPEEQVDP
ncbi:MAG: hypothetical protein JW797_12430 [Bradymonadales bacterium]|nr:hypothetical protein [Bradymonadales bacterium]